MTGRHPDTFKLNGNGAIPDNVVVDFCVLLDGGAVRIPITLPLFDDEKACFYIHPKNWPRVDVVAIPFDPYTAYPMAGLLSDGTEINRSIPLFMNSEGVQILSPMQDYLLKRNEIVEQWFSGVDVTEELFHPRGIKERSRYVRSLSGSVPPSHPLYKWAGTGRKNFSWIAHRRKACPVRPFSTTTHRVRFQCTDQQCN